MDMPKEDITCWAIQVLVKILNLITNLRTQTTISKENAYKNIDNKDIYTIYQKVHRNITKCFCNQQF